MQFNKLPALVLLSLSFSAMADIQLTKAELLGTWKIEKESSSADGSKARISNTSWTFKEDGTIEGLTQESDAHARIDQMRAVLNYSLESGKIVKQAAPGRSKMETCEAVEKQGDNMVLKCQTVYFFMTKSK